MRGKRSWFLYPALLLAAYTIIFPQSKITIHPSSVQNTLTAVKNAKININNISTVFYNNGISDCNIISGNINLPLDKYTKVQSYSFNGNGYNETPAFVYPKSGGKTCVFNTGFIWGGKINNIWCMGGSTFLSGLQPGRILSDGTAESSSLASVRVYRVRSDYKHFTSQTEMNLLFADEMLDEGKTAQQIYDQYDKDWNEWPAAYGAPYIDINGDGKYDPTIDVPGISKDPCQTLWYVCNDLDASLVNSFSGSLPMGIEMQATLWAYKSDDNSLQNSVFRKYKLINKSHLKIDSMFVCLYSDPDIGDEGDDFAGSDPGLALMYAYNGNKSDKIYGQTIPAIGFQLLQSPYVKATDKDSAYISGGYVKGLKNIGMTSMFTTYKGNFSDYRGDPSIGDYSKGAMWFKNYFCGKMPISGKFFKNPLTQKNSKFMLTGNPIDGSGWVDTLQATPKDIRIAISSGPFIMNADDSQETTYVETAGEESDETGFRIMRDYVTSIGRSWANYGFVPVGIETNKNSLPQDFLLWQNYPNPFNPSTMIKYKIAQTSNVLIKVYDLLGREITTLVNEEKYPGEYNVKFNGNSLSSGVYIYRIAAGNYSQTRKMLLLK